MPAPASLGTLTPAQFRALAAAYRRDTGYALLLADAEGCIRLPVAARLRRDAPDGRAQAIREALRWGEVCVCLEDDEHLAWAVPLMRNQELLGGLVVCRVPLALPGGAGSLDGSVRRACDRLLALAVEHNLTNEALLRERRREAARESERALAVQALKTRLYEDMRRVYLREEPALLAALRRGDKAEARFLANSVLAAVGMLGRSRLDLLRSLCLELVVVMTRAAVQAGGDPARVLAMNYQSLARLAEFPDRESLSRWLCDMLDVLIDEVRSRARRPVAAQLVRAIELMESRLGESLSRDAVARDAGLSPGHFSRLMRRTTGLSFTQLLTRLRIERACERLLRGEEIAAVAQACGFGDQSYFTRVFRRATGRTPGGYRRLSG